MPFDRELGGEYFKPGLVLVRPSVGEIIELIYWLSVAIVVNGQGMGKYTQLSLSRTQ